MWGYPNLFLVTQPYVDFHKFEQVEIMRLLIMAQTGELDTIAGGQAAVRPDAAKSKNECDGTHVCM